MRQEMIKNLVMISLILTAGCAGSPLIERPVTVSLLPGDRVEVGLFDRSMVALEDPYSDLWLEQVTYSTEIVQAPPVFPAIALLADDSPSVSDAYLRVARDKERFYVWLRWQDPGENSANAFETFCDGAAIQFAVGDHRKTNFMMGSEEQPVLIWYWKADGTGPQLITAAGFGTATQIDLNELAATGHYNSETHSWTLVLSQPLKNAYSAGSLNLDSNAEIALTLAFWQGEDNNRDGFKRTSTGWILAGSIPD